MKSNEVKNKHNLSEQTGKLSTVYSKKKKKVMFEKGSKKI